MTQPLFFSSPHEPSSTPSLSLFLSLSFSLLPSLSFSPSVRTAGHKMSDLPLEPQLAKMLLISPEYNCSNEVRSRSGKRCVATWILNVGWCISSAYVQCCAVLYYAMQSYTVLCCSMLWWSKLHHRILRVITLCNILLYLLLSCAIQCCAALSSAALCCIIFCCIIYSSDRDHRKYCVKLFYQICHWYYHLFSIR